jgi:hypothetical protein
LQLPASARSGGPLLHGIRAGAAFSALVNTLVIALVALLPGASLGQAGIIVAAAGLATTSGLVVVLYREHQQKISLGDVSMLAILFGLYGLQLASAVQLDGSPRSVSGVSRQGVLLIAFFLFGIARSWQLVGARDFGVASTVAAVIHRPASASTHPEDGEQAAKANPAASKDDP